MVSESVRELESRVTDQTRDIETLNADIRQKEQRNIELARDYDGMTATLSQKTDEIQNLRMECDSTRIRLESAGHALDEEKIRSESLGKQVIDLTSGLDQQKSELLAERNRFLAAEQEISMLKQEKIRSENELNRIINRLNETTNLQETEIDRLKGEIETQTNLGESAEREIIALKQEKIRSENELNQIINRLNETTNLQETEIDRLKGEIGAETDRRVSGREPGRFTQGRKSVNSVAAVFPKQKRFGKRLQDSRKRSVNRRQHLRPSRNCVEPPKKKQAH